MTAYYHQKHKERFRKEVRERYQNFSGEEKDKKQKKYCVIYQNFSDGEKEERRNKNLSEELKKESR